MATIHTNRKSAFHLHQIIASFAFSITLLPAFAGTLTMPTEPLFGAAGANVYPNLMFLLDASGSMGWDYVPDYVNNFNPTPTKPEYTSCFDSGNTTTTSITDVRRNCYVGDPPFMSPDFNSIYYNPDFTYLPGWNGTLTTAASYPSQSITAVTPDPYGIQNNSQLVNSTSTTVNLTTTYPDRFWCDGTAATAPTSDTVHCKHNVDGYTYPDATFKYLPTSGGTSPSSPSTGVPAAIGKYVVGAPYYWRIIPTEYCNDRDLKNCADWTSPLVDASVGGTTYSANKYCADAALTSCQATKDSSHRNPAKCFGSVCTTPGTGSTYSIPAPTRFCKPNSSAINTTPLIDCQGAYNEITGYTVPKFLGYVTPTTGDYATGTVTITAATPGLSITDVRVDGTSVGISSAYTVPVGATPESVAAGLKARLTGTTYAISVSGRTISIASTSIGSTYNGKVVTVTGPASTSSGSAATATITVNSSAAGNYRVGPICVGNIHGTYPSQTCDLSSSVDNLGTVISSQFDTTADPTTPSGRVFLAGKISDAINSFPSGGYVADNHGTNVVSITAPSVGNLTSSIGFMTVSRADTTGTGTITVIGTVAGPQTYKISSIKVGSTTISTGAFSFTGDMTVTADQNTAAANIASLIGLGGYSALASNNVVTITPPAGTAGSGTLAFVGGAVAAAGTITVNNSGLGGSNHIRTYNITNIKVGSTIVASNLIFNADLTTTSGRNSAATLIKNSIGNGYIGSCAGGSNCSSNVVTVTALTPGSASNNTLTVTSAATVPPNMTVTISGTFSGAKISSITLTSCSDGNFNFTSTTGILSSATSTANTSSSLATAVGTSGLKSGVPLTMGISGSTITFSPATGSAGGLNNCHMTISTTSTTGTPMFTYSPTSGTFTGNDALPSSTTALTGGLDQLPAVLSGVSGGTDLLTPATTLAAFSGGTNAAGTIPTINTNFAGGANSGGSETRQAVGDFKRCDIVPGADCAGLGSGNFPRASTRTDCSASDHCTYAEESVNFANWYAYYRTRMQSMKTAAGLAFKDITITYRIGFATIYTTSNTALDFVAIADFDDAQRKKWYTTFYARKANGGTPLRSALARIGQMYAKQGDLYNADPVKYACQQNFTLMTTDGYWNTDSCNAVKQANNSTPISQQDAQSSGGRGSIPLEMWDGGLGGSCLNDTDGPSSVGTLADVAYYYAHTDLRDATAFTPSNCTPGSGSESEVCTNNVSPANLSEPHFQHMDTFTLGLGVRGTLRYQSNYDTASSGDFYDIKNQIGGKKWPQVHGDTQLAVDDLWHAAVNGFGKYFSAANPSQLKNSLTETLSTIKAAVGAGAAAATSAQTLSGPSNFAYVASYKTKDWIGNIEARPINATTGAVDVSASWCVSDVTGDTSTHIAPCVGSLKSLSSTDSRNIYLFDPGNTSGNYLRSFSTSNLSSTELTYFTPCPSSGSVSALHQCSSLGTTTIAAANANTLVNYLRGQNGFEMGITTNTYQAYRHRQQVLGDVVAANPLYVGPPNGTYSDSFYAAYVAANTARSTSVFVGANDGMMHAFNADVGSSGGTERWAYIPTQMLPKMRYLAEDTYGDNHKYFINGPSVVADVCFNTCASISDWRTILVSGYGAGGRGYFALDVTDPNNPVGLWELDATTDGDFGYSFGNPIITKRPDGKWVVLLTSGYNNSSGKGVLFVVEPNTGHILTKITNNSGSAGSPSGLAKIESFIADAFHDNTTHFVYGGDLNGNIWRFSLEVGSEYVVKVAEFADSLSNPQPVTTKPILTTLDDSAKTPYVIVGTGLLIQGDDKSNASKQSIYGFSEKYDSTCAADTTSTGCTHADRGYVTYPFAGAAAIGSTVEVPSTIATVGNCGGSNVIAPALPGTCPKGARNQLLGTTLVADGQDNLGRNQRKTSSTVVNPDKTPVVSGCYVDLPDTGERVNVDPILVNGEVLAPTNVPDNSACSAGGHSYRNVFNYKTCHADQSVEEASSLIAGHTVVIDANGNVRDEVTFIGEPTPHATDPIPTGSTKFLGKRSGWRILGD